MPIEELEKRIQLRIEPKPFHVMSMHLGLPEPLRIIWRQRVDQPVIPHASSPGIMPDAGGPANSNLITNHQVEGYSRVGRVIGGQGAHMHQRLAKFPHQTHSSGVGGQNTVRTRYTGRRNATAYVLCTSKLLY